jgi:hypothetical protein
MCYEERVEGSRVVGDGSIQWLQAAWRPMDDDQIVRQLAANSLLAGVTTLQQLVNARQDILFVHEIAKNNSLETLKF